MTSLLLTRTEHTPEAIFGELRLYCGDAREHPFRCYTLENLAAAIPVGLYRVSLYLSPRFQRIVPLLHAVPGRSEIEIHVGNFVHETQGCILVGEIKDRSSIGQSNLAFDALMVELNKAAPPFQLMITEELTA